MRETHSIDPNLAVRAVALWAVCLAAHATLPDFGYLSLEDGYDMKVVFNTLHVEDRHDRCVLSIPLSETAPEQFYYCELPKALLFKLAPMPGETAEAAGTPSYFVLQKGKRLDSATPLTEDDLQRQIGELSIDGSDVKWTLAAAEVLPWYRYLTPFAIPLGVILPIPFLVLIVRYVKLLRQVYRLERSVVKTLSGPAAPPEEGQP